MFRGQTAILKEQINAYLSTALRVPFEPLPTNWFVSNNFLDFAGEGSAKEFGAAIPPSISALIELYPAEALRHYLVSMAAGERRHAVSNWSQHSSHLIGNIQRRYNLVRNETKEMQDSAYRANLLIEKIDFIFKLAAERNLPLTRLSDLTDNQWLDMTARVPLFDVEASLATKIEREGRQIDENDIRDVHSFTTAICFSDLVVGEKATVNRAKQARLGERYSVKLLTSLQELHAVMAQQL